MPEENAGRSSTDYGEAWVYESVVGALPGVEISGRVAVLVQILLFELSVVGVWAYYGLPRVTLLAGSAAVLVAAAGSVVMLQLGERIRTADAPPAYTRLLFGSGVEVVLGVLAFVALVTHLFVYDPRVTDAALVETLFGADPPVLAVYLALLVLWDVTYRIGTSWWACVVAVWRSWRFEFDAETTRRLQGADAVNLTFGVVQTVMLPFLVDRPVLLAVVAGHVLAVVGTAGLSILLLRAGETDDRPAVSRG
jgi:hypothetical protein